MTWSPASYLVARPGCEPLPVAGYTYRGLGVHMVIPASPKGRRPPLWAITHLNTGHRVLQLTGRVRDAFPVAAAVAELTDWDFDGLAGWRNRDPELPGRLVELARAHPKVLAHAGGNASDQAQAVAISSARA